MGRSNYSSLVTRRQTTKFLIEQKEAVIVYGASSSVGAYAVQLAKLAGYFVVGIAGSSSSYADTLGADVILDHRKHGKKPEELVRV